MGNTTYRDALRKGRAVREAEQRPLAQREARRRDALDAAREVGFGHRESVVGER